MVVGKRRRGRKETALVPRRRHRPARRGVGAAGAVACVLDRRVERYMSKDGYGRM